MTVKELVNRVETNLRLMGIDPPGDADILEFLNEENQRVSRELQIPSRYVTQIDATVPFAMPLEAQPGSLTFAETTEDSDHGSNRGLEVYTVAEANKYYPDWERNEHQGYSTFRRRIIIYDPGNISAPVYPIGFRAGDKLRVTYLVKPKPLAFDDPDATALVSLEPFEALIPEYHSILYRLTTYQIAMLMGDNTQLQKARVLFAEAMGELGDAFSYARPGYQLPRVGWSGRP